MQRFARRLLPFAVLAPLLAVLTACGGNSVTGPTPTPPPTPPPPPAAAVTATGDGKLVVHPSASPRFAIALETPIRIQETAGGAANWDFARFSVIKGGKEIERGELGSTPIRAAGLSSIAPKSNLPTTIVFRFNAPDFDDLTLTLGFTDTHTLAKFTVDVPFSSFGGVDFNVTPMNIPSHTVEKR
jgi:hypothetical protein